jgi:FkbM family methyltransferase
MLRQNASSFPNVEVVHAAIFDRPGPVFLENPKEDAWGFRVQRLDSSAREAAPAIPGLTMDDLVGRFNGKIIDLLKLDIEGAELEVFSSDSLAWLKRVRMINVELHDRFRPGCSAAFESAVAGYRAHTRRTVHNVLWTNLDV